MGAMAWAARGSGWRFDGVVQVLFGAAATAFVSAVAWVLFRDG